MLVLPAPLQASLKRGRAALKVAVSRCKPRVVVGLVWVCLMSRGNAAHTWLVYECTGRVMCTGEFRIQEGDVDFDALREVSKLQAKLLRMKTD